MSAKDLATVTAQHIHSNHPKKTQENQMKTDRELAMEMSMETIRLSAAQTQALVDAYADMGHAAADLMRRVAAARFPQPEKALKAPPPVSTHLRRFVKALAEKVTATIALLTDEQRTRLGALVPAFTGAALANEPDVFVMVIRWLDLPPDVLARELAASVDDLEKRFAS